MRTVDNAAIERFMRGQVACWNAHDKAGFLALYRELAPESLEMWDKHNRQITLDVVTTIINGSEAAVHHRNCIAGTDLAIESIETYRFEPGRLFVRYFLKPPAGAEVNLDQFRGLAPPLPSGANA